MFDPELDTIKSIDLRCYAASQGYQLDRKESWAGSAVMRHPNGDKIIIKRDAADGHYVYFSVRDDADNGSIIDFVRRRLGCSLGGVRKELRPWIGMPSSALPPYPPLQKVAKDRIRVERAFARMQNASAHPYLEDERAIPRELLAGRRFAGRIRIDARGNAIFPHEDETGLCGFEMKNHNFTSFAAGGTKGLWTSHIRTEDRALILAESGIDALSYAAQFPDEAARYASIGGKMTPKQKELIRSAAAVMPGPSVVIAAVDADSAGAEIAGVIETAVRLTGRADLRFERHSPEGNKHKDWNDVLKSRPKLNSPCRQEEPTVS